MPRYRMTIEYNGAPFVGWQRQENGPSVQGALEQALTRLGESAAVQGAGRTDAGVHATGQVCHVDLAREWDAFRLSEALNYHLKPDPVAVLEAARVSDQFHARFSAVERRYLYRIVCRRAPLAIEKGLAWRVNHSLELAPMRKAAAMLIGLHDFTTFRSSQCQAESPVKTLDEIDIEQKGDEIRFRLRARSFLHNQVRSLVGTLERVGAEAWAPERVAEALEARDRAACGPVAPAMGLYLTEVRYPAEV